MDGREIRRRGFGYDFGIYRNYINGYFDRLGDPTVVPFGFSAFSNTPAPRQFNRPNFVWLVFCVERNDFGCAVLRC